MASSKESKKFTVERILDKRYNPTTGNIEYYLKWNGHEDTENAWEAEGDLDCPDQIAEFEAELVLKEETENEKQESTSTEESESESETDDEKVMNPNQDLVAEEILAVMQSTQGELLVLIKWAGTHKMEFVANEIARVKYPQLLIKYYEKRLPWCLPTYEDD